MKGEGHMFNWIARNLSTIIICLVLAAVVVLIIVSLVKDKRKGLRLQVRPLSDGRLLP